MNDLLDILAEFGGGRGDPANTAVRFLLPVLFWGVLIAVSAQHWKKERNRKDLIIAIAALFGIARELFMFISEYGSLKGYVSFKFMFHYYPPFEHAVTMLAGIMIGYAFLIYFLKWRRFPRLFVIIGTAVTTLLYIITAPLWIKYLNVYPNTLFGSFWGDMAFRVCAAILLFTVIAAFAYGRWKRIHVPLVLFVAFTFLFTDEFLMIFNLANHEKYIQIYAPIRHNLHIWAIPLFLFVYWSDMKHRLSKSEQLRNNIYMLSHDLLCVTDLKGTIRLASPAALNILGHSSPSLIGKNILDYGFAPDGLTQATSPHTNSSTGWHIQLEYPYTHPDGDIRILNWKIRTDTDERLLYIIISDVSRTKHMEKELIKLDKIESLGVLAGGIAHDFNNILTSIKGNIDLAVMSYGDKEKVTERLREASKALIRAKDLSNRILTFAKGGTPVKKPVRISSIVHDSCTFSLSGSNCTYIYTAHTEMEVVNGDPGQLNQMVQNLVLNAKQAMPEGGLIEIRTSRFNAGPDTQLPLSEGEYIKLSITDHGQGIARKHLSKIFDPFFTTKSNGSGLGLASAFSIARNHGGHIEVDTQPGSGTTFHVYLPVLRDILLNKEERIDTSPTRGKGNILVLEDEQPVQEALGQMLIGLGYSVTCTEDGARTVELYADALTRGTPYEAVILDLTIRGGLGGEKTQELLRKLDPSVRSIVSSGYADIPVLSHYQDYGFLGLLKKPYSLRELSEVLNTVLKNTNE